MLNSFFGTLLNAVALLLMVAFLALIVAVKTLPFMLVIYLGLALAKIKNKKKPLLFSFLTIFAILFMANLELYFAPYPMIDTVLAEKFSIQEWQQIKPGMTRSEVIEKIGEGHLNGPFTILPAEGESDCIGYTSDNKVALIADFAWIGMGVCYDDNDIVTRTYQNIVRN